MRFFRDECFMEEGGARREAERGTFDPTYLVYSVGKLMLLKLRRDYKEQQGSEVLAARVPRSAAGQRHRDVRRAPPADARRRDAATCSSRPGFTTLCRCTSTSARPAATASSGSRSSRIRRSRVPELRRAKVQKLLSSPAIQFKGSGWYITDYAKKERGGKPTGEGAGLERAERAQRRERREVRRREKSERVDESPRDVERRPKESTASKESTKPSTPVFDSTTSTTQRVRRVSLLLPFCSTWCARSMFSERGTRGTARSGPAV